MDCTTLIYDKQERTDIIALTRPGVLNAINRQLFCDLQLLLDEVEVDKEVRVVVITGAGRAFSSWADLKERVQHEDNLEKM